MAGASATGIECPAEGFSFAGRGADLFFGVVQVFALDEYRELSEAGSLVPASFFADACDEGEAAEDDEQAGDHSGGDLFIEKDGAPNHAEGRDEEGDSYRLGWTNVFDQIVIEDVAQGG